MVTVIAGETLAEYQIIHKNASLYTNTSILAHSKNFTSSEPEEIDDELIGFDSEKNIPVSIPLDIINNQSYQIFSDKINKTPSSYGVFTKKKPKWLFAVIFTGIIITAILIPAIYISSENNILVIFENPIEPPPEMLPMPSAFEILTFIAELFLKEKGEIDLWQFNYEIAPSLIIQCNSISALTAHNIFKEIDYLSLDDIQIVNYINNEPVIAISLRTMHDIYKLPSLNIFPQQSEMLAASTELINELNKQHITIISETFPSGDNNYKLYTINYLANDRNLIYSMEIIEELCKKYDLLVYRLDIAADTERNIFNITCSLSHSYPINNQNIEQDNKKHLIPLAFGYRPPPPQQPQQPVINLSYPVITEVISERMSLIGTIRDSNGKLIYFHDSNGRINIRSEL
jgi:hypothetical protein